MKRHQYVHWQTMGTPYKLDLTEGFYPFPEDFVSVEYSHSVFPGGEQNLRLGEIQYPDHELYISSKFEKDEDILKIILANDAAKRMGFMDIKLFLPYFPGARQDRICNDGEALTVKVYADLINSCGFSKVYILCPHSDVTPALIDNVKVLGELVYVDQVMSSPLLSGAKHVNVVCPDAGAMKRIDKIMKHLQSSHFQSFDLVKCDKIRNLQTGKITSFNVDMLKSKVHEPYIIFDDINCYGGTFLGILKEIRKVSSAPVYLFTVHSDCQEGLENVCSRFSHVFTTDSKLKLINTQPPNSTILKVKL